MERFFTVLLAFLVFLGIWWISAERQFLNDEPLPETYWESVEHPSRVLDGQEVSPLGSSHEEFNRKSEEQSIQRSIALARRVRAAIPAITDTVRSDGRLVSEAMDELLDPDGIRDEGWVSRLQGDELLVTYSGTSKQGAIVELFWLVDQNNRVVPQNAIATDVSK